MRATMLTFRRSCLLVAVICVLSCVSINAFVSPAAGRGYSCATEKVANFAQWKVREQPLFLSSDDSPSDPQEGSSKLPMLLDIGTKGGALFLSLVLFIIPIIGYEIVTEVFGFDGIEAGRWIGVGFTFFTTVLWVGTYIFRVATKDMTYAKQLKDYENAVIAKRLEELDEDEIQALVEDIERDEF
jgi:hypothetical protein